MKNSQKKALKQFAQQEISKEGTKAVKGGSADIVIVEIIAA